MKQSKGSKQVKMMNLSSLDGVYDVSLGNKAASKPAPANYARSEHTQRHPELGSYDDVKARLAKAGVS
jgi:hypothetical protein